jgi:hypothetical protein
LNRRVRPIEELKVALEEKWVALYQRLRVRPALTLSLAGDEQLAQAAIEPLRLWVLDQHEGHGKGGCDLEGGGLQVRVSGAT